MTTLDLWLPPPVNLALSDDEVHVWRAFLDLTLSHVSSLQNTLAADELQRAERFHLQKDRNRFIVSRGLLRMILGRYLGIEPDQLQFCYSSHGKPGVSAALVGDGLHFNLSHSHRIALYAVTRGQEVGIDVEHIQPAKADEQVAERFFSPKEAATLRALPSNVWTQAFFTCWTRKEAYIKAKGEGLALPLDQFDVSVVPGEPAALLSTKADFQEARRWSLQDLNPGNGYAAALAVEGHFCQIKCWQWTGIEIP